MSCSLFERAASRMGSFRIGELDLATLRYLPTHGAERDLPNRKREGVAILVAALLLAQLQHTCAYTCSRIGKRTYLVMQTATDPRARWSQGGSPNAAADHGFCWLNEDASATRRLRMRTENVVCVHEARLLRLALTWQPIDSTPRSRRLHCSDHRRTDNRARTTRDSKFAAASPRPFGTTRAVDGGAAPKRYCISSTSETSLG